MMVHVTCSGCSQRLQIAPDSAGEQVRCPLCQAVFTAIPLADVVSARPNDGAAISLEKPLPVSRPAVASGRAVANPFARRQGVSGWLILLLVGVPAGFFGVLIVAVLLGAYFWLDRRARDDIPSPDAPQAALVERRELDLVDPRPERLRPFIAPDAHDVVPPPVDFNPPPDEIMRELPPEVAARLRRLMQPDAPPQVDPNVPLIRTIKAHTTCVWSVAFSADGGTLLTADGYFGPPGHVKLWKTATGELLDTLQNAESDVLSTAFSPDERQVASAAGDAGLHLIDRSTRRIKSRIQHPSYVRSAAFSRDGKWLASNCENCVRVWDIEGNRELWQAPMRGELPAWRIATPLAFAPDGKTLAAASGSNEMHVHEAATGKLLSACVGHEGIVICTAWSPDGKRLASGSFDRTIKLWDPVSFKEQRTLRGHKDWVFSIAVAPDSRRLASAGREGAVIVWDAGTGKRLASFQAHSSEAVCVAFAPDGKLLASSGVDGTVKLWDVSKLKSD